MDNGNMNGNRPDPRNMNSGRSANRPRPSVEASDATQRVRVDPDASAGYRQRPRPSGQYPARRTSGSNSRQRKKTGLLANFPFLKNRGTIIALAGVAAILLIVIIISGIALLSIPEDNGLILNNVYAAGVNLGGKTPEQAKIALTEATSNTYSKLDMVVNVHNTELVFSPKDTGASLDVDGVVEAAYNYGRTGTRAERQQAKNQTMTGSHVVSILPYLTLDKAHIRTTVESLGSKYSSTLSQPSYRVEGSAPNLNVSGPDVDTDKVYQTLYITTGTAEYGLDINKLMDQILDGYNTNIFQVSGSISVVTPEPLNLQAIFDELCVAPVDAVLNEETYEVTPGKYGYGFLLDDVTAMLDQADFGQELKISLKYLRPALTEEDLNDGLFEKALATISTPATVDKDLLINLKLACRVLDGMIIKVDDSFSFNSVIGNPTATAGYKEVTTYVGKELKPVVGGGLSRISSALYYCAVNADLEILERHNHTYVPSFVQAGFDADIQHGAMDMSFRNTTGRPIRIEAEVSDAGVLTVSIWGTENKDQTVDVVYETIRTHTPSELEHIMYADNPGNYRDGDVLVQPIIGYDVCTYRIYRYADSPAGTEPVKKLVAYSHYEKVDKVVVKTQTGTPIQPDETPDPDNSQTPNDPDNNPTP